MRLSNCTEVELVQMASDPENVFKILVGECIVMHVN